MKSSIDGEIQVDKVKAQIVEIKDIESQQVSFNKVNQGSKNTQID